MTRRRSIASRSMVSILALATALSPAYAQEDAVSCADDETRTCGARSDNNRLDREAIRPNAERHHRLSDDYIGGPGFSISVDGERQHGASETILPIDQQRAADLAATAANIDLRFDETLAAPVLNVAASAPTVRRGGTATFLTYTNYSAFMTRAEIRIFDAAASVKGEPLAVLPADIGGAAQWRAQTADPSVQYVLRVYGAEGRFDETRPQRLSIADGDYAAHAFTAALAQEDKTAVRNIPLAGGTVRAFVRKLKPGERVLVMNGEAERLHEGKAYAERIVPHGEHDIDVVIIGDDGEAVRVSRPVNIARDDHFLVGIADLTFVHEAIDGTSELAGPETDFEDNFVEGRIAFYYKGKIRGKYLITAAADTRENRIGNLFSNFTEKDQRAFLRRIDPDRFYPVYGDDSVTVEDAPTAGKFYVRVERGQSSVLWGNFHTELTGTEFVNYARGLYGGNVRYVSQSQTSHGEARVRISGFAADPGTVNSREEFRGTNGTVFYFRNQDIVEGSERLFVEVRDRVSGIVRVRQELIVARDYDINYIQGRVLLREALPAVSDGVLFVRDAALAGDPVYLIASYEFAPTFIEPENFTTGGRGEAWLNDHVKLGVSGYRQNGDGFEQALIGGDITLRLKPSTYIKAELANADGPGSGELISGSGGFEFVDRPGADRSAMALRIEGASNLADIDERLNGAATFYYQDREAGFSAPGQLTLNGEAVEQYGGAFDIGLAPRLDFSFKADIRDGDNNDAEAIEGGMRKSFTNGLFANAGVRYDNRSSSLAGGGTASPTLNRMGARTDLAVDVGYASRLNENADIDWSASVFGQLSLDHDAARQGNDRIGVTGDMRLSRRASVNGEVSAGELGLGAKAGVDYQLSEQGSVYLAYTLAGEAPDSFNTGRLGRITAGARTRYTDDVSVFAETRYDHGTGPTGLTQAYGVDWTPGERWAYGASFETGDVIDPTVGDISRDAVAGSASYSSDALRMAGALEYRNERSEQTGDRRIYAWRYNVNYQVNEGLRLYGKVNGATANDQNDQLNDAEFWEAVAAGAYRPVAHDRLNALLKYTYLEDLPSSAQITATGANVDFAQRSHVFSIDATYDVNSWLAFGGKYAYRVSELRASRDPSAPWFDSRSDFVAARADIRFVEGWELLGEVRRLRVFEADDSRIGGLAAVYRQIGDHLKIGAGYNFTDFSDDLTDLSFSERGVFFNLLGKY